MEYGSFAFGYGRAAAPYLESNNWHCLDRTRNQVHLNQLLDDVMLQSS